MKLATGLAAALVLWAVGSYGSQNATGEGVPAVGDAKVAGPVHSLADVTGYFQAVADAKVAGPDGSACPTCPFEPEAVADAKVAGFRRIWGTAVADPKVARDGDPIPPPRPAVVDAKTAGDGPYPPPPPPAVADAKVAGQSTVALLDAVADAKIASTTYADGNMPDRPRGGAIVDTKVAGLAAAREQVSPRVAVARDGRRILNLNAPKAAK